MEMYAQKTTVWCAISSKKIIGPYFYEQKETVTSSNYCLMLEKFFLPKLKRRCPKNMYIYFQQDGATPHTADITIEYLKKNFQIN